MQIPRLRERVQRELIGETRNSLPRHARRWRVTKSRCAPAGRRDVQIAIVLGSLFSCLGKRRRDFVRIRVSARYLHRFRRTVAKADVREGLTLCLSR